jgi:branched-chain amino acid transport system substrate-binding protein
MPYVNGSLSVTSGKDPASPAQANDAAIREYKQLMAKYAPGANANNALHIYGFGLAETFVQAMYKAGKNPTRASYMNALLSFNSTNRFLLNGVRMKSSKTDHFIVSQMRLQRFNDGSWTPLGPLVEGRPR